MRRLLAVATALLLQATAAPAQDRQPGPSVGDVYEIRSESASAERSGDGSSSSNGRNMLVERVIAVSDDGVEVEFDLPEDTPAEDRARTWQFPVRVLRPPKGGLQLLNRAELEGRVDSWLERAGLPREACGSWYFSWNAFQIECDPDIVIQGIAALDSWPDELRDGAPYQEPGARGPAVLRSQTRGSDGSVFVAEMEVDPETVRRGRAQGDVVVAEIGGKRLTLEAALQARSGERISGTSTVTFQTDGAGRMRRRTKVTELAIEGGAEGRETRTVTETVERRLVSRGGS